MPGKYLNVKEAAQTLGVSEDEIKQLLERRELHGYRDGADWKFKPEDIEKIAKERASSSDEDDVLLNETELGPADPGMSGTVIGMEMPDKGAMESDVRLADSDIQLTAAAPKAPAKKKDEVASKVSDFEELDLTLDQDVHLADSTVGGGAKKPAVSDSSVDLSGKNLDDDDMVLGGSGSGSDITIGGDSGISLVDPADSGLSLEEPLNLGAGEESLELGEDDLLTFSTDTSSPSIKTDDDFQLTPMPESEGDDSESGSQVIALDTEGEGDEGVTMIGSGGSMAAMLDEDLGGGEASLGLAAPMAAGAAGAVEMTLASPGGFVAGASMMQPVAALPEAPYSAWNILSLVLCSLLLAFAGVMIFDLMAHQRSFDSPHYVSSAILDWFLNWFGK